MTYDIVIRGGTVVDGLMTPAYQADIAIKDGKVAAIGRMTARGTEEIDARGKVVAPGFVDMHTHMDGQLFWDPMASPSSLHGITSVMIANCGFALTPAKPAARDWVTSMLSRVEGIPLEALRSGLKFEWETYGEYLAALQRRKLGVNVGAMVPHSNIRYEVMGEDARKRAATAEERERIVAYLTSGMQAGGFGLSSSWNNGHADGDGIPVPSRFADREELLALATALRDFPVGGIEFTPRGLTEGLKSEDFSLLGDLSRAAGKPINWNALFDVYGKPGLWRQEIEWMERENANGARIYAINSCFAIDVDFCFATAGNLFDDRPHWSKALALPLPERKRTLADPAYRAKMKADFNVQGGLFSPRWEDVTVSVAARPENKKLEGRRITDIARERGLDPIDALLDVALSEDLLTEFFRRAVQNDDEAVVAQFLKHPLSLPGVSDGGAHLEYLCQYGWPVKLIGYWVREKGALGLEDAVRRCSFLPAQLAGFRDRGFIRDGAPADMVVFDYDKLTLSDVRWVKDVPGGQRRKVHHPVGMQCVLVNGQVTIRDNQPTGALSGTVLRSTDYAQGSRDATHGAQRRDRSAA